MASMASASPDMSLLSSHFNKIASGTGDMRSSSPHSTSSLASFYNSFVNSPYSSHQSVGSSSPGGGGTHPGWCHGQSATVDSYLITAATDQHPILQNKVKSLAGTGALVQEHSSLSSSCKGNAGAVLLQHMGSVETSREWAQQVEDTKACSQYGGSMASLLSTPTSYNRARAPPRSSGNRVHHMTEGAMIRELIDRMGGGTSNNQAGTIPSSSMGVSISHRPGHPMEKLLNLGSSSCSNAPAGLTNDHPSKAAGGLATLKGGVGLAATSRSSLAQFSGSSDPGFTSPLAAKFSPFCSNAANYPQAPQQTIPALLAADDRETISPRSGGGGGQQGHESNVGKLSPTSSTVVGLVKIAGGECISSFQNSLEGTTRVNTGAQDSQAATRVRMISDDEKEPTGNGSSLPSLEAIEGARKNSVADEAAGLESFDPGESETNSFTLHDAGPHEPLEKKRKKVTAPADDCRGHASSSLCPPESVVFENDNTLKPKRCKNEDGTPRKSTTKEEVQKPKAEGSSQNAADNSDNDSSQGRSKEINTGKSSHADLCKQDYIHVRARRGQATDSHSLAERIRREKISERMKHLQDLVPGCSKVTGKAVMLDEIINYVQSLQRQVEVQIYASSKLIYSLHCGLEFSSMFVVHVQFSLLFKQLSLRVLSSKN
jgi:hypothetical protein